MKYEFTGEVKVVFGVSLKRIRAAVIKTHGEESKHGKTYLGIANLIEYHFSEVV